MNKLSKHGMWLMHDLYLCLIRCDWVAFAHDMHNFTLYHYYLLDLLAVQWMCCDRDSSSSTSEMTPEERREQQKKEEALHASSLRVPRRHVLFLSLELTVHGLLTWICWSSLGHHGIPKCQWKSLMLMNDKHFWLGAAALPGKVLSNIIDNC